MSVAVATASRVSIESEGIAHRFAPGRGLEPVNFSIASPGAYAVTGPNGSGKSTLFRILAGLLRPNAGRLEVAVLGVTVPPNARRSCVSLASPELTFYDEFTVAENLGFAGEALGLDRVRERVGAVLERVGLERRLDDRASALSSGMKQRLRLAFALLSEAPLLLLDEPGSHLDDEGRAVVAQIVEAQRGSGLVMIATNDEREWRLADRRIELRGPGLGRPA